MTFTDYRTAARMRDTIAEVAGDVVDRKRPGYRYATVDNIDEVKNRANVLFAGEVTAVPVRMGTIKPQAGALVRVRGKHGDLHVEGVVDGVVDFDAGKVFFANGDNSYLRYSTDPDTGGLKIADQDNSAHSWFPYRSGSFYFTSRADFTEGEGHWIFRSWDGVSYTERFRIEVGGQVLVTGDLNLQNNALVASYPSETNVDHIWHDEASNEWHFVSDGTYKQDGNSVLVVGGIRLPANASMIKFGDANTDGPVGFEFMGAEGRLYYRSAPNTLGVEDGAQSAIMEWDVDDHTTHIWGLVDLHDNTLDNVRHIVGYGTGLTIIRSGGEMRLGAGSTDWWSIATGGDFLTDAATNSSEPRLRVNATPRGFVFRGDADTGLTNRSAGSGGLNLTTDGGDTMLATSGTANGVIAPSADNSVYLGTAGLRWEHLFVADGMVRTSDLDRKEDVQPSDLGLEFVRRLNPISYRRRDGGKRRRYGLGAEEVRAALDDMGKGDFGGYVDPSIVDPEKAVNPWAADTLAEANKTSLRRKAVALLELEGEVVEEEVQNIMEEIRQRREIGWQEDFERDKNGPKGLRYDEFIAPMIKAIQELADRVESLEGSPSGPPQ